MPSIYDIKPKFQDLLRPLTNCLAAREVTANHVTLAAMVLSFVAGACLYLWPGRMTLFMIPFVLFIRMALNAIDGMLAREHDMRTPLGAILNELGDIFSDAALYLPLLRVEGFSPMLVVPIVLISIISETTGIIGVQIGADRRYDGPMGKSDRAFVFGTVAFFLGCGILPREWIQWILGIVLLLLIVTIFNRANKALKQVQS